MKKEIKGIIFDVGGVLVTEVMDICLKNAAKNLGIPLSRLRSILADREIAGLQTGKVTSLQYWHAVCTKLDIPAPDNKILASLWEKTYAKTRKKNIGTIRLAKKLKKRVPVAILSNTIAGHAAYNRKTGVYAGFDPVILSHEVGLHKPQKEIFLLTTEKMKIAPGNLLFIDDCPRYVKAARAAGLNAIRFRSAQQLEIKLKSLGLL
jgi:FMN phosphatase YigB (HAD superfamily)